MANPVRKWVGGCACRFSELLMRVGGFWPDLSSLVPLRPLCERRKFLHDNMVEIPNRIMFSEMKQVTVSKDPIPDSSLVV